MNLGALARVETTTPASISGAVAVSHAAGEQKEADSGASHFAEEAAAIALLTDGAASPAEASMVRASGGDPNRFACLVVHRLCRARVEAVAARPQPRTSTTSSRSTKKTMNPREKSLSMKMSSTDSGHLESTKFNDDYDDNADDQYGDSVGDDEKALLDAHLASWSRFVEDLTEVSELLNQCNRKSPPVDDASGLAEDAVDEGEKSTGAGAAWALKHALDLLLGAQRDDAALEEQHRDGHDGSACVAADSNISGSDDERSESDKDEDDGSGRNGSAMAGRGDENENSAVVTILAALNRLSNSTGSTTGTTSSTAAAEALVLARASALCERARGPRSACLSEARVCLASLPWSSPPLDACRRMLRAARMLALPTNRHGFGFRHRWPKLLGQAHVGDIGAAATTSGTHCNITSDRTMSTSDAKNKPPNGYFPLRDAIAWGGGGPGLAVLQAVLAEKPRMYAARSAAAHAQSVPVSLSSSLQSFSASSQAAPARSFKELFGRSSKSARNSTPVDSLLPLGPLKSNNNATATGASGVGSGLLEVATLLGMPDQSLEMARARACLAAAALNTGDLDSALHLAHSAVLYSPPGHRERARRGKGYVYACCFAGALGMGRSHGRLVHIGPGALAH